MALHTRTLLSSAFYFIMCVLLVKDSAVCGEGSVKGGGETDEPFYTFVQVEQASGGTGGNICKLKNKTKHHERDLLVIGSLAEGSQNYWTMEKITKTYCLFSFPFVFN